MIGKKCFVAAGALVTERKVFPDRSLILGAPAKVVRELTNQEIVGLLEVSDEYVRRRAAYAATLSSIS